MGGMRTKDMFRVIIYDAGACSLANAAAVRAHNLHYVFGLTAAQPTLFEEARRWLGSRSAEVADAITRDRDHGNIVVRRIYVGPATAAPEGWDHLRSVLRIETETLDASGNRLRIGNRYVISSLAAGRGTTDRGWGVGYAGSGALRFAVNSGNGEGSERVWRAPRRAGFGLRGSKQRVPHSKPRRRPGFIRYAGHGRGCDVDRWKYVQ